MDEATIVAAFGQKLKRLRAAEGMTLEALSQACGMSISTISKIEDRQQKPSFETVLRMARVEGEFCRDVGAGAASTPVYPNAFCDYATHAAELTRKAMIPLIMRIRTREAPAADEWSVHAGEVCFRGRGGAGVSHRALRAHAVAQRR